MGPYKCPDCGIWWAGFEHRCQPLGTSTGTTIREYLPDGTYVVCTCAGRSQDSITVRPCLVHDVPTTFTTWHS
jgi:hypothetical protein